MSDKAATPQTPRARWFASRILFVVLCAGCASMMPNSSHWRLGRSDGLLPEPKLGQTEPLGDDVPFPITGKDEQKREAFVQIPSTNDEPSDADPENEVTLPQLSQPMITPGDITVPAVLDLQISAPSRKQVGSGITYRLVIHNTGDEPADGIVIESEFDKALVFPGRNEKRARQKLASIPSGSTRELALTLVCSQTGRQCCRFRILRDGEEVVWKEVCVDFLEPMLDVDLVGPSSRTVGSSGEYVVTLKNTSDKAITDLVATLVHDRALKMAAASEGYTEKFGSLTWNIAELAPGESVPFQAEFLCEMTAEHACMQLDIVGKEIPDYQHDLCLEVLPVRGVLDVRLTDTRDLINKGDQTEFVVSVHNDGLQAVSNVKLRCIIPKNCRVVAAFAKQDDEAIDIAYSPNRGTITFDAVNNLEPDATLSYHVQVTAVKSGNGWFQADVTHNDTKRGVSVREVLTVK
ncbi:MAG: hypothetical protein CMJ78_07535 [Planctomycetaceae bacterium]|nr:hypothetical protein [Planctomycetaceae bacterium]